MNPEDSPLKLTKERYTLDRTPAAGEGPLGAVRLLDRFTAGFRVLIGLEP